MKAPSFQWYPKDCDTDESVMQMSDEAFGLYIRLLNHAWINGGLPTDPAEIARTLRRDRRYFARIWPQVSGHFVETSSRLRGEVQEKSPGSPGEVSEKSGGSLRDFSEKSARLVNPKQEELRRQLDEYKESRRQNANGRRDAYASSPQNGMHQSASATASATASAIEELPPTVPPPGDVLPKPAPPKRARPEVRPETSAWFEGFWSESWRRGGKREALEAADRKIHTSAEREQAMAKMLHDRPEQLTHDLEHRKHLSSWINSGRWSDPIEAEPAPMGLVVANGQARGSPLSTWERKDLEFKQKLKERLLSQNGVSHAIQR